jgi:Serine/threonine protein kinase
MIKKSNQNSWHKCFDVIEELGEGGNAKVYLVKEKQTGKSFALKELYNKSSEKRGRFIDEINIMTDYCKKVEGIIPIIESSIEELWYIMPVAEPIIKHINKSKQSIQEITKGVIQLSETLSQLHSVGISHRDIKPSNIYYYNERYYFGDFGLVDFPDNPNDFTRSDKGLGAIFTIAPEMKRDPKNADGKKADVFSLAKTTWMLLSGDERGFDGVYNFNDMSHGLHFMENLKDVHLVELEELLAKATDNTPKFRPDIISFKQRLEFWLNILSDTEESHASDWKFLNRYLFGDQPPESTIWRDADKIIDVLNIISSVPAYNHMLFSDGGGLDFSRAERATEPDCINIYDSIGFCLVVKPKCLYFEGFNNDYRWNYFLLELNELYPILNKSDLPYEYLVEDTPGNYVSAEGAQYGIYDYDSGKPLPEGYKTISRYLNGKFLIVLKDGPYNGIPATYDGRHGLCSNGEFREYVDYLIKVFNQLKDLGMDEESILNNTAFGESPFFNKESIEIDELRKEISSYKNPEKFITDNYYKWNFKEVFWEGKDKGNIEFYFEFHIDSKSRSIFSDKKLYLCSDGNIKGLASVNLSEIYYIYDRDEAKQLYKRCIDFISSKCIANGFGEPIYENYFSIQFKRCENPTHLFTKSEIEEAMRNADDRKNNMLVIDENGFAKIIQNINDGYLFPVRNESWGAGNVYVGKYSRLSTLNDDYIASLQGWLLYLQTGRKVYMDYTHENTNVAELLDSIKKYY